MNLMPILFRLQPGQTLLDRQFLHQSRVCVLQFYFLLKVNSLIMISQQITDDELWKNGSVPSIQTFLLQ